MNTDEKADAVLRAFWAIEIPQEMKRALGDLQGRLREGVPRASWTAPQNFHLTLAFLGNIPQADLPQILVAGGEVAQGHRAFTLRTSELGAFPDAGRARALWLGLEADASVNGLARDLQRAMAELGLAVDEKPFIPHLTLARLRSPRKVHLGNLNLAALLEIREIVLYQSRQSPHGSIYTSLGTFALG